MERLTELHYKKSDGYYARCSEHCNDICDCNCEKWGEIVDRLGAYEDTGLEPEEIGLLAKQRALYVDACGEIPLKRIRNLVQASPFRGAIYPGATVYCICEDFPCFYPKTGGRYISEETVGAVGVGRFYVGDPSDDTIFEESEIGKTVFLTREEAEAALREEIADER
jgi:hypothetical protein